MKRISLGPVSVLLFHGDTVALSALPPHALALDGVVRGPSESADDFGRWSFDHHDDCSRLVTLATCEQIRTAILFGLDVEQRPAAINDIDADTLLSLWLLRYPERAEEGRVKELVRAVGAVDAHGPAGRRLLSSQEGRLQERLFDRLRILLGRPGQVQQDFESWPRLLKLGMETIDYILKDEEVAPETPPEPRCSCVCEGELDGQEAIIVESDDWGCFDKLYASGYRVVVLCGPTLDGEDPETTTYTVGKVSDLVAYDLRGALARLDAREPGWGGGSSIGGSPRPGGSRLKASEVWALLSND